MEFDEALTVLDHPRHRSRGALQSSIGTMNAARGTVQAVAEPDDRLVFGTFNGPDATVKGRRKRRRRP